MVAHFLYAQNKTHKMKNLANSILIDNPKDGNTPFQVKQISDRMIDYFLAGYFIVGIIFSFFYDTYFVALTVGSLCLISYYGTKWLFPNSTLYQYVLSAVMGIFMAQYIFEMHGMFEMHFLAFISSALLITYQNWKLQLPLTIVVVLHHSIFGYLQYSGNQHIYFTQLDYMELHTFIIHVLFAATIFFICGLWAYQLKKYTAKQLEYTFEMARLSESEAQKETLLQANKELDKFVYSVSHDLRAPLSSMKGVIEITKDETQDEFILTNLDLLQGSIKKLDEFIIDILEYSRNCRQEAKKQEINFQELLAEIDSNLKHMHGNNSRPVDLKYEIQNSNTCLSDKSKITILLNNLISNAIRYQNPKTTNPKVEVHINVSNVETGIIVKDNGIGISKENHKKIFEMFYRVTENTVGTGLGLFLVKEIVEKLDGKIDIESEVGKGTSFIIRLPNKIEHHLA